MNTLARRNQFVNNLATLNYTWWSVTTSLTLCITTDWELTPIWQEYTGLWDAKQAVYIKKDHFPHINANHPLEGAVKKQLTCEIPIPKERLETKNAQFPFWHLGRLQRQLPQLQPSCNEKKASESSKCNPPRENSTGAHILPQNLTKTNFAWSVSCSHNLHLLSI